MHLATTVRDLERSPQFYCDVFGMSVMYHEAKMIQLTTPESNNILVFEEKNGPTGKTDGAAHFGFRLKNPAGMKAITGRIRKNGSGGD